MECNSNIRNEMRLSDKVTLFLLCLYFILKPFYFWSSGLPQVSDCVLLIMMIFYIIKDRFCIRFYMQSKMFIYTSLVFIVYVLFINILWSLILNGNLEFFTISAFYIFNFLASLMVVMLYHEYHDDFFKYIYTSILISTFIQLAIYIVSGGFDGRRALAFFNNPNQLGYYNLLVLGFLLMISQRLTLKTWWFVSSVIASLILCFSSLSKAAIVGYSGMLIFFLLTKIKAKLFDKRIIIYLVIMISILSMACYFNREIITSNQLYTSVVNRISSIGSDNDDNLSARGYDRFTNYPQYLAFGAGEGEYLRLGYSVELHSTLGNILISYGITGLVLYLASILFSIKNSGYKDLYIVFFIFLYGLTHNGIRNTLLWMLVALISVGDINSNTIRK